MAKIKKYSSRNSYLLSKYGITEQQYEELYNSQSGCCAVCGRHSNQFSIRLSVDHDHKTGEIRGLLCKYCNRYVVGRHRKEAGSTLLKSAYEYLDRVYPGWIVPERKKKRKKRRKKK